MNEVTYQSIRQSGEISAYIRMADEAMKAIGYTEHSLAHVTKAAQDAARLLEGLDYPARTVELARIAAHMHDIGNVVNRHDHAHSGALMAFRLLDKMGMPAQEIGLIVRAIGNHDEATGAPIDEITAALILADKSDVRRSRVREAGRTDLDIHDRVNYAVESSALLLDAQARALTLRLTIDTNQCAVMEYFEIFLSRMVMCRRAAQHLRLDFKLIINEATLL